LAALSKEKEQAKDRRSVITTQIQPLGVFHPAEPEHQVAIPLYFPLFEHPDTVDYNSSIISLYLCELNFYVRNLN
jgi:hypothetical protein